VSAGTQTVLERIVGETRAEVQRRKRELPLAELRASASALPKRAFRAALRESLERERIAVIAEFKRRSPSAGTLRENPDLVEVVRAYERGGANALSVLTEGPNFGGSLEDLRTAKQACGLPVLRKDFIVDSYQLHESVAAGADAVLLIAAALSQEELRKLHARARRLRLEVLVEVHDEQELRRARAVKAQMIGINNRDLRDFSVDVGRTFQLMSRMPPRVTRVSESGIQTYDQLFELYIRGLDAVLVGETLMRAADPERALRELRGR
jgi:indole-3-glycerol phosphate synthase